MINAWTLVGVGFNAAIVGMAVVWYVGRWLKNAGYIEAAWPAVFALVVGLFALIGNGSPWRKALVAGLVALWAVRLTTYLVARVARNHQEEDLRFRELRKQFPKRPWHMFFGFAMLQAFLIGLLVAPLAVACCNASPHFELVEKIAVGLVLAGWLGVTVADFQLDRFRQNPANASQVCQGGLWRFSRHPNYFFEWLIWVGYFLFAVAVPGGWWVIYAPLLMLVLLTKATGIPVSEARALQNRGAAYEDYQRRTSAFIPWPPRKATR